VASLCAIVRVCVCVCVCECVKVRVGVCVCVSVFARLSSGNSGKLMAFFLTNRTWQLEDEKVLKETEEISN
jgi:hypothetical protein